MAETRSVNAELLDQLKQGGYVLYMRHGETGEDIDQPNLRFDDCSTQRNLSEAGRQSAVRLGAAVRDLRIPIRLPILASPFCRTQETAQLAFGRDSVRTDMLGYRIYRLSSSVTPAEMQATLTALTAALEQIPPAGLNTVLVAHSFPKGLGLGEIPPLGTVVAKPGGAGKGYQIVGRISLEEWLSRDK
ncbi:histidine phosphatase family protein [Paenibacillus sp. PR3]|uniref:Histidine phosphatase family protein n=2 Tax=Paenibacillus terricola TaxID=2763503 RepID=A0ABR8MTB8_9BACL|nr:histidine phosphatase family protein [Paenibacillus terricola]